MAGRGTLGFWAPTMARQGRCLTGGPVGPAAVHDLPVDGLMSCPLAAAATRFPSPEPHLAVLGSVPTSFSCGRLVPREAVPFVMLQDSLRNLVTLDT